MIRSLPSTSLVKSSDAFNCCNLVLTAVSVVTVVTAVSVVTFVTVVTAVTFVTVVTTVILQHVG